jgi:hypothetical protein
LTGLNKASSSFAAALVMLCATACVHRIASPSWRLANNVLTPPGVAGPFVVQETVKTEAGAKGVCPPGIRLRRREAFVKVNHNELTNHPPGWLTIWTAELESKGCIAEGSAFRLASSIAESLPLEMNSAFRLLNSSDPDVVEINPNVRLQIMTPIMAPGASPDAPIIEAATVTGNGTSLNLDARFTENLLGYEMTWYSVQPKNQFPGVAVTPFATERHVNNQTEHVPLPIHNYFESLGGTSFYGLFYKGGQTEFTALIVGATSKADFDRRIKLLEGGVASCQALNNEMCVTIPKRAAINPMVSATVNGKEIFLHWGANVRNAIEAGGEYQANTVLPQLRVLKSFRGRSTPLEFDRTDPAVLNLILMGGEEISWK